MTNKNEMDLKGIDLLVTSDVAECPLCKDHLPIIGEFATAVTTVTERIETECPRRKR